MTGGTAIEGVTEKLKGMGQYVIFTPEIQVKKVAPYNEATMISSVYTLYPYLVYHEHGATALQYCTPETLQAIDRRLTEMQAAATVADAQIIT